MKAGISRTMVLPATLPLLNNKHPICCFYTVSPTSIGRKTLPDLPPNNQSKKLPHHPNQQPRHT
jgi:hypothetical protein